MAQWRFCRFSFISRSFLFLVSFLHAASLCCYSLLFSSLNHTDANITGQMLLSHLTCDFPPSVSPFSHSVLVPELQFFHICYSNYLKLPQSKGNFRYKVKSGLISFFLSIHSTAPGKLSAQLISIYHPSLSWSRGADGGKRNQITFCSRR